MSSNSGVKEAKKTTQGNVKVKGKVFVSFGWDESFSWK